MTPWPCVLLNSFVFGMHCDFCGEDKRTFQNAEVRGDPCALRLGCVWDRDTLMNGCSGSASFFPSFWAIFPILTCLLLDVSEWGPLSGLKSSVLVKRLCVTVAFVPARLWTTGSPKDKLRAVRRVWHDSWGSSFNYVTVPSAPKVEEGEACGKGALKILAWASGPAF